MCTHCPSLVPAPPGLLQPLPLRALSLTGSSTTWLASPSSATILSIYTSPRTPCTLQGPVTPKRTQGNEEVVPTSQSSQVRVYTPVHLNDISQPRNDTQDSVDNWRHGQSAYRCEIVSPLQFAPEGDYLMEIDRPLSPLTSCSQSASLGSCYNLASSLRKRNDVQGKGWLDFSSL